ncbi:MAG: RidA family protein [Candidatus Korarchaeota archaeon]
MSSVEEKLKMLGIKLPEPPIPLGAYVPAVKIGNLLVISGMLPMVGKELAVRGKLGSGEDSIPIEQVHEAGRLAALNALAVANSVLGSLNKIKRVVFMIGFIAASPDFDQHSLALNGASEMLLTIFGEKGMHARAAVGVTSLPGNSPIEIVVVFEVE